MLREIMIKPCLNGYLLYVGCANVVFEKRADMLAHLEHYYEDPEGYEKVFISAYKIPGTREQVETCGTNRASEVAPTIFTAQ